MRDIIKNIKLSIDGADMDFRLTKLDAFSGVSLLRLLMRTPAALCHSERSEESPPSSAHRISR